MIVYSFTDACFVVHYKNFQVKLKHAQNNVVCGHTARPKTLYLLWLSMDCAEWCSSSKMCPLPQIVSFFPPACIEKPSHLRKK